MFFKNKFERVLKKKEEIEEEKLPLERGDILAMLIAAFLTFIPIIFILGGLAYLIMWFFVR